MIKEMSTEEFKKYIQSHHEDSYILLDVREPHEYYTSHIPGALHIPLKELENSILAYDSEKDLICYCRSGRRSRIACEIIDKMGLSFKNIYNLTGGILAWQGNTLKGIPKLNLFHPNKSVSELLKIAISFEKATEDFYSEIVNYLPHDASKVAKSLANLEIRHAKIVYEILKKIEPECEEFELLYTDRYALVEGGYNKDELITIIKDGDKQNLIEIAIEIELSAYELYKNLSYIMSNEGREVFLQLAEQEKMHAKLVSSINLS